MSDEPVPVDGLVAASTLGHVSDDPGRPDYTIDGAPGAMLIIISGPSGVGKDTIIDELRRQERATGREDDRQYVVTVTTRPPRPGEVDGVDYQFVSRDEFLRMRDARGFLEANEVHGNWYGSPRQPVRGALAVGKDVILKIDVQGAQVVKEQVTQALLIFVVPPTMEELFHRLRNRATETADQLELRQRNAALELARQGDYDEVVTNETGQVEETARKIEGIIARQHRLNPTRRVRV
ncbi:MAG TPA: guanylate kinase [Candidatus Limnocylindrales bacterium]|nr:guanylate kinase [Candidatus Limnocylindrales bacterium]